MKKRYLFYTAIIGASLYFVFLAFFSSLSYNVNTPSPTVKSLFNLSAPEGWGFFTRSPREEMVDIYEFENSKLETALHKNIHYSNFFGISRKSRKLAMEASIVMGKIKDSIWVSEVGIENLKIPLRAYSVNSELLYHLNCGNYVFVKRKTVPWAWRKNINEKDVPYEIAHIKIDRVN